MVSFFNSRIGNFRQHWFVKNTALLQIGSFSGTLTQAITGVILARLLQPELFGIYSLAFGVASLASIFLGGGSQDAVATIASETYHQKNFTLTHEALAYLIKVSFFAAFIALIIAVWSPLLTQIIYNNGRIGWYATIIIFAASLSTLFFSATSVGLQISGEIGKLTILNMLDQVLRFGLSLLFVFFGGGVLGAVLGHLIGSIVIFFICLIFWRNLQTNYQIFPKFREFLSQIIKVPISKYLRFSFWVAVDRNISTLYNSLPILLTGIFVLPSEVTFFKLSFGYLNIALSLLGPISILLNVEFPKMKVLDLQRLFSSFKKVSYYSLGLSFILTVGATLLAPLAFRILYGPNFEMSVPYVFGLFLYGALFGIGVGLGPMWRAVNKVKVSILINVLTLALGVPLGLYLIQHYGLWGSVIMVTLWYTVSHFVSFLYLRSLLLKLSRIG